VNKWITEPSVVLSGLLSGLHGRVSVLWPFGVALMGNSIITVVLLARQRPPVAFWACLQVFLRLWVVRLGKPLHGAHGAIRGLCLFPETTSPRLCGWNIHMWLLSDCDLACDVGRETVCQRGRDGNPRFARIVDQITRKVVPAFPKKHGWLALFLVLQGRAIE
jgi:hypothetical protein